MSIPTSPSPMASLSFPSLVQEPIKPNPHPYAIRTTSTGVLSRSNSSGRNLAASHHHYVPLPPSPTKGEGKGHRVVKSASSLANLKSPQPLPVPPEFSSSNVSQRTRADTLPSTLTEEPLPLSQVDLPANPKLWTVSQLSSYLLAALRLPSMSSDPSDTLPLAIIQDVAAIMKEAKINGRAFLRLKEEDFDNMGINQKWRTALLNASRTLRQSAIKAQIWGSDSDTSPPGSGPLVLPSHPYSSAHYNSSGSLDLASDGEEHDKPRRRHRGRVRGMVDSFERSGSFSSESSVDDSNFGDRASFGRWLQEDAKEPVDDAVVVCPTLDQLPPIPVLRTDAVCIDQPEEPSIEALLANDADADADRTYSWGARAWEELDLAPGITVKRIAEEDAGYERQERQEHVSGTVVPREAAEGSKGSTRGSGRGRAERRVVTAIFAPRATADDVSENPLDATPAVDIERPSKTSGEQAVQTAAGLEDVERAREVALEAELAETRALVEAFKVRLEGVERELTALQELEAQREREYVQSRDNAKCPERTVDGVTAQVPGSSTGSPPLSADPKEQAAGDALSPATHLPQLLPTASQRVSAAISGVASIFSGDDLNEEADTEPDKHDEPALSHLPQYVFLVGVGVCAVVLQVMLRKFVGRNTTFGWR